MVRKNLRVGVNKKEEKLKRENLGGEYVQKYGRNYRYEWRERVSCKYGRQKTLLQLRK